MSNRFHWLKGDSKPKVAPWDIDLTADRQFATVPSRGSIVEGWLLTLPRRSVINMASLSAIDRKALIIQARATAISHSGDAYQTTFFEHGPVRRDTPTGCGVDHAHLHAVPLAFDLFATLPTNMNWFEVDPDDPWATLGMHDYLLVGRGNRWLACEPEIPESQFFRKRIAEAETGGYGWDHNHEFWTDNVRRTISKFTADR